MEYYQTLRKMMSKFLKSQNKIIFSVSLVSLIFSYLGFLRLPFSTFPFHLLGLVLNKNCIFVICNGLLVFVAKTSADSICSSSGFDLNEVFHVELCEGLMETSTPKTKEPLLIKHVVEEVDEEDEEDDDNDDDDDIADDDIDHDHDHDHHDDEGNEANEVKELKGKEEDKIEEGKLVDECLREERKKLENLAMEDLEGDNKDKKGSLFDDHEEDDEDEGEEESKEEEEEEECMELLSIEELNKKFEDFIQRMKEDFRMGSSTPNGYNGQVNYNYDINLYDKNWPIIIVN